MRRLLRQLRPDRFEDIIALIALYRPGPMEQIPVYIRGKQNPATVKTLHPLLDEITADTHGVIVYQEQIINLLQRVAGYSAGEADIVRKAIGKKIEALMRKEEPRFREGCRAQGLTDEQAAALWRLIQPFAGYSFNRAHAAGYGLVTWQTAYLRAHYPVEYMAALLTSVKDDKDARPKYLGSCRRMGITVLPPDVNESDTNFTPAPDGAAAVRYGLSAVRNVGEQVVEAIAASRHARGRFTSFLDFCHKVDTSVLNKRVVESLIKAGAFDSFLVPRRALAEAHERVVDRALTTRRAEASGQFSLFGSAGDADAVHLEPEEPLGTACWERAVQLAHEKEMLGQYVSDHPLTGMERRMAELSDTRLAGLAERGDGAIVTVVGVVARLVRRTTRKGDAYVVAELEDLDGVAECMVFPQVYAQAQGILAQDRIVTVRARVDGRDESPKLVALDVAAADLSDTNSRPLVLRLAAQTFSEPLVYQLKEVLAAHRGHLPVLLEVQGAARVMVVRLGDGFRVDTRNGLFAELKAMLGPDAVAV